MSAATRINRPTYATPRKLPSGRMVHVSTHYRWVPNNPFFPTGPATFRKVLRGITYRRPA